MLDDLFSVISFKTSAIFDLKTKVKTFFWESNFSNLTVFLFSALSAFITKSDSKNLEGMSLLGL